MCRGVEATSLWHCSGVMEAQDALMPAFSSFVLLGLVSLMFLLTISHRFSMGFRSGVWKGLVTHIIRIGTLTALQWFIYDSV
ncbi:hypothetical protein SKAU_G00151880 [Synaphobranchus kaupii]|uniref:Uncharacterized protein n=1 Tax=Synaphobranchus kaupii TaxID=118154 RepID=A0A9Q1FGY1_SYNKA|nr:hypothetical protein SKAU_G00151880 [Synaphobranchus kaupii]